jgi:hypothetical protein
MLVKVAVGVAVSVAVGVGVSVAVGVAVGRMITGDGFGAGGAVGRVGEGATNTGGVNPGNTSPRVGVGKASVGSPAAVGVGVAFAPALGRCRMKSAANPIK